LKPSLFSFEHQVTRVARARNTDEQSVRNVVKEIIENRQFGVLGEKRVNVLRLNMALDERFKQ